MNVPNPIFLQAFQYSILGAGLGTDVPNEPPPLRGAHPDFGGSGESPSHMYTSASPAPGVPLIVQVALPAFHAMQTARIFYEVMQHASRMLPSAFATGGASEDMVPSEGMSAGSTTKSDFAEPGTAR